MKTHCESRGDVNEGNRKTSKTLKAKKASDHTSQGRTSHDDHITHHVDKDILGVDQDWELLQELTQENYDVSAQEEDGQSARAKIQKVRRFFKNYDNIKNYFNPREFSVGPLHAANPTLLRKHLKLKLAKKFLDNSKIPGSTFLQKIKSNIQGLKGCFHEWSIPDRYNDDFLARLFFLDGCAVLQFIRCCVRDELEEVFKINITQAAIIQQDLFLLENQIPFQVLTLLMDVMDKDTTDMEVTKRPSCLFKLCTIQFVHVNNIFANVLNYYVNRRSCRQVDIGVLDKIKPAHLLDLLRKVSMFGSVMDVKEDERDDRNKHVPITICGQSKECLASLHCFREQEVTRQEPADMPALFLLELEKHERIADRSRRSVQELKSVGIAVEISDSRSLTSASFSTHCLGIFGHLKLPALNLNNSTVSKLFNLLAYETCLGEDIPYSVTSYLNFLDFLIDTEQDVNKLRTAGVLRNAFGSDAEVARLFNTIGLTYLPKSHHDHFEKIHSKIEKHYSRTLNIRMATICTTYLIRNPWPTLLTLIALLFTAVQTWYTVHPKG